jgi:hypothetical protein
MKNKVFLAIGFILVFSFVFVGCASAPVNRQLIEFEGTWKNPNGSQPTYTFIGDTWTFSNNNNQSMSGTFTFTDKRMTFIVDGSGRKWTQPYTFEGNTLRLTQVEGSNFGPFVKQ